MSHGIIHTFKNYFATVFSFQQNKLHPNGLLFMEKKEGSHKTIVQDKLDIMNDEDKGKVMLRKGIVKEMLERQRSNSNIADDA